VPPGTLYVVATPLGNLDDLTVRAGAVLRSVPVIAAEDTRRTRILLSHLDAHPRLLSFHAHSPARRRDVLLELLQEGSDVALVSDAGTPAISDPGADLVRAVRAAGVRVVPIPGVSAVATLLSVAGLPADRYLFLGFLPRRGPERRKLLAEAVGSPRAVVLYEAPTRARELLTDLAQAAAGTAESRRVIVGRELTKLHEEISDLSLQQAIDRFTAEQPRGELTIVLAPAQDGEPGPSSGPVPATLARELLGSGLSRRAAAAELARRAGISRNQAYRIVLEVT